MELFEAVSKNDVIKVMRLLESGVSPNQMHSDRQYTVLHYAVHSNAMDAVLLLVTAGADLETLTEENMTVFDIAREHKNKKMMDFLVKLSHMKLAKKKTNAAFH